MAYESVNNPRGPYLPLDEDFELSTRYDVGSHDNILPATGAPGRNDKDRVEDTKIPFGSKELPLGQWPANPECVAIITPWKALVMVFDALLASTPIMFITLALLAVRLNGKELSDYGNRLVQTLLLSPTIFPLLFAALMGRFFRYLSLWLAQQGTTLGLLEQLVGCQSVFSALERQICLRSWSAVGLASILVWLISPLGGQSALRLLVVEDQEIQSAGQVRYLSPATIMDSFMSGASSVNSGRSTFTSIFLGTLLSSDAYQTWPKDLWGNVKLPIYRYIENSTSDEWKLLPKPDFDTNITYASLIGVPIVSKHTFGENSYTMRARQWDFTCSSNEVTTEEPTELNEGYTWQISVYDDTHPHCVDRRNCTLNWQCDGYPCPIRSESLASKGVSITDCNLSLGHYEAEVRCNEGICGVQRMRKLDLFDEYYSPSDDDRLRKVFVANQLISLPSVDTYGPGSAIVRGSTNMEKWINDPSDIIGVGSRYVDLGKLSPDIFAERLTILYNTFWQSTYGTRTLGGNLPESILETGQWDAAEYGTNLSFIASEATFLDYGSRIYKVSWKWFTALLFCSMVLLAAAYIGLVLKYITIAPDIIGYASSLTIMNPYLLTPTGGTTLDGLQRSALLRDLPVRIGDVCPNDPVGSIAFAKNNVGRVARLDRRRRYI